jgi:hypothetical protein
MGCAHVGAFTGVGAITPDTNNDVSPEKEPSSELTRDFIALAGTVAIPPAMQGLTWNETLRQEKASR